MFPLLVVSTSRDVSRDNGILSFSTFTLRSSSSVVTAGAPTHNILSGSSSPPRVATILSDVADGERSSSLLTVVFNPRFELTVRIELGWPTFVSEIYVVSLQFVTLYVHTIPLKWRTPVRNAHPCIPTEKSLVKKRIKFRN
jgi:hypothetical protein